MTSPEQIEISIFDIEQLPPVIVDVLRSQPEAERLSQLAKLALNRQFTDLFLSHLEQLLPDIVARWSESNEIGLILAGLGRIIPFAQYLAPLVQKYLLELEIQQALHDFISKATENNEPESSEALAEFLLGLFRLLSFDNELFGRAFKLGSIQSLLKHGCERVRYLAARVLCLYLRAADAATQAITLNHTGSHIIEAAWEGITINYRFLSLWEETRYEANVKRIEAPHHAVQHKAQSSSVTLPVSNSDIHPRAIHVLGILLPSPERSLGNNSLPFPLVHTRATVRNLQHITRATLQSHPLLIAGPPGCGKSMLINFLARSLSKFDSMLTLHLNEQSDIKALIGLYSSGPRPGTFQWRPGALTTAVREGRWIVVEDLDRVPNEILATLLPLLESRELSIPERRETVKAAPGFKLFATVRTHANSRNPNSSPINGKIGERLWNAIIMDTLDQDDVQQIIRESFPTAHALTDRIMDVYKELNYIQGEPSFTFAYSQGSVRAWSLRDLTKWCSRISGSLTQQGEFTENELDLAFLDALDCFASSLREGELLHTVSKAIARGLQVGFERSEHLRITRKIKFRRSSTAVVSRLGIGRVSLPVISRKLVSPGSEKHYSVNTHSLRLLERIAGAVHHREQLLLVGETGTGKTTSIQYLASAVGQKLHVINLSQQSESGDFLGGFKPVNARTTLIPLKDEFDELFQATFSGRDQANEKYAQLLGRCIANAQWDKVFRLWNHVMSTVQDRYSKIASKGITTRDELNAKKKRKLATLPPLEKWKDLSDRMDSAKMQITNASRSMVFAFVESNLVKAVRSGQWVLLDEINLASHETLECLLDLLQPGFGGPPFLQLTESGTMERVEAHPNFRLFAAMNPSTDIGKKELAPGIRSLFTEIFVDTPDKDLASLRNIVEAYLGCGPAESALAADVSSVYIELQSLVKQHVLVDGSGQEPHFSLRTLSRALLYAHDMRAYCSNARAVCEGMHMSFLTLLDRRSETLALRLIWKGLYGVDQTRPPELKRPLRLPSNAQDFVQYGNYWLLRGAFDCVDQAGYIVTPLIRRNLDALIRAVSTRRFPILIEGATSSGKTSMIEHLARKTGNKFVRINNHEHTDLREYIGSYTSDEDGRLYFQDGVLVQAMRNGHWIVLDELNLASSDVLEALNRLLDDNRELLIPETQEVVRPHKSFVLFATQNPAGLYGGRKTLSRALRNRFLELHFEDIPIDELTDILHQRCAIPESRARLMVSVYAELQSLRQESRIFDKKGFATLRDLFRWANRGADTLQQLAENGYMLIAERARSPQEKDSVRRIIESVMSSRGPKVDLQLENLYDQKFSRLQQFHGAINTSQIVLTPAMRRLICLVAEAAMHGEPVLLVGETGCGKTSVCQLVAQMFGRTLQTVNAHQNTEAGDLIGSQRPIRDRSSIESKLRMLLSTHFADQLQCIESQPVPQMLEEFDSLQSSELLTDVRDEISLLRSRFNRLFEWVDGSLVQAMKDGQYFLLDEISLADDSVLERLNSVLETDRTIFLAEKGTPDALVRAAEHFRFLATMNPSGDYGKRELSPALRNRFTEIWVPSPSQAEDIEPVIRAKLDPVFAGAAKKIVNFTEWYCKTLTSTTRVAISIRDAISWAEFMNNCKNLGCLRALVHGAALVFIDTLGADPSAMMRISSFDIERNRMQCLDHLALLAGAGVHEIYYEQQHIILSGARFQIGDFAISRLPTRELETIAFAFEASTTKSNAMRVLRALQISKPLLIEGNPGVGKTTMVMALARAVNRRLVRMNLSEHTDLSDLFGADVPLEGSDVGRFVWKDGPFLRAMQQGDWVLLDEMNLASQSVLEGLNSCLDHRAEVYLAELNCTFSRHPNFRLFATQNPHLQGGGRNGLPTSFVNRFSVVYCEALRTTDLSLISRHLHPDIPGIEISKLISFIDAVEKGAVRCKEFGNLGSPWEFNMRDLLRWLDLKSADKLLLPAANVHDFVEVLFLQRFRTKADRERVASISMDTFGTYERQRLYHNLSKSTYQVGLGLTKRKMVVSQAATNVAELPVEHLNLTESLLMCIEMRWPVLLVGGSGSGKTRLLKHVALQTGTRLVSIPMTSAIDAIDMVGGFEQEDGARQIGCTLKDLRDYMEQCVIETIGGFEPALISSAEGLEFLHEIRNWTWDSTCQERLCNMMQQRLSRPDLRRNSVLRNAAGALAMEKSASAHVRFQWVDSVLVTALERGDWVVLDNANLCNASVLDRLNSLLEPDGELVISECMGQNGQPRRVKPHAGFRIFLTMDPRFGELSRAMRNRAVELFVPSVTESTALSTARSSKAGPDSTMYRFNLGRHMLTQDMADSAYSATLNIMYDHLSLGDWESASSFRDQLRLGLFDSAPRLSSKASLSHQPLPILAESSFFSLVQAYYADAVTNRSTFNDIQDSCVICPLNNEPVVHLNRFVQSRAISILKLYELQALLSVMRARLDTEVNRLTNGRPPNPAKEPAETLTSKRGMTIRASNILSFLRNSYRIIAERLDQSPGEYIDRSTGLRTFCELWWKLLEFASDETGKRAAMDVYVALARDVLHKIDNTPTEARDLQGDLLKAIEPLYQASELNTGQFMEILWSIYAHRFKTTSVQLDFEDRVNTLADRFDNIAWKTRSRPEDIAKIRRAFVQSFQCPFAAGPGDGDRFAEMEGLLLKLESDICRRNVDEATTVEPYFQTTFAAFYQLHTLTEISNLDEDLLMTLAKVPMRTNVHRKSARRSQEDRFDMLHAIKSPESSSELLPFRWHITLLSQLFNSNKGTLSQMETMQSELKMLGRIVSMSTSRSTLSAIPSSLDFHLDRISCLIFHASAHSKLTQTLKSSTTQGQNRPTGLVVPLRKLGRRIRQHLQVEEPDGSWTQSAADLWIDVGLTGLRLYVPDKMHDPALRLFIERDLFLERRNSLQIKISAAMAFNEAFSNNKGSLRVHLMEDEIEDMGEEPQGPRVVRTKSSIHKQLQGEFAHLVDLLRPLSESTTKGARASLLTSTFRRNLDQVLQRLEKYQELQDLAYPAIVYLRCVLLGMELTTALPSHQPLPQDLEHLLAIIPFLGQFSSGESLSDARTEIAASADAEFQLLVLKYLVVESHDFTTPDKARWTRSMTHELISCLFHRSKDVLDTLQRKNAEKSKMYHYRETSGDEDESDDLEAFLAEPNKTETVAESLEVPTILGRIAAQLCDMHEAFCSGISGSASQYLHELLLDASGYVERRIRDHEISSSILSAEHLLPALILKLDAESAAMKPDQDSRKHYNFYVDANIRQAQIYMALLSKVQQRFFDIRDVWPDHAVPADILIICDEAMHFRLNEPVTKLLTKAEKLHEALHQWQKIASRQYSVASLYDELTILLVSWRQLELESWKSLLDLEEQKCVQDAKQWWHLAYENIIAIPEASVLSGVMPEGYEIQLLDILENFIQSSSIGQFSQRLRLLDRFVEHLRGSAEGDPLYWSLQIALHNFVCHYRDYRDPVSMAKADGRKRLEKDIHEVILLASWRDRSIESLRQSSKASHRKLIKLIKRFRAVLNEPFTNILARGRPDPLDLKISASQRSKLYESSAAVETRAVNLCQARLQQFDKRPLRFVHIQATVNVMKVQVDKHFTVLHRSTSLNSFIQELQGDVRVLHKATPTIITDENKSKVKYLKSQKKKLLVRVLQDLKKMGLKPNPTSDILEKQATISAVLCRLPALNDCNESNLHSAIESMPGVRQVVSHHSEDLNIEEVSRCVGFLESLMHLSIRNRFTLAQAKVQAEQNIAIENSLQTLLSNQNSHFDRCSFGEKRRIPRIREHFKWLRINLELCVRIIEAQVSLGHDSSANAVPVLQRHIELLGKQTQKLGELPELPGNLISESYAAAIANSDQTLQELNLTTYKFISEYPELLYLLPHLETMPYEEQPQDENTVNDASQGSQSIEAFRHDVFQAADLVLASIQDFDACFVHEATCDHEESWLLQHEKTMRKAFRALHCEQICGSLHRIWKSIPFIKTPGADAVQLALALLIIVYPIFDQYFRIVDDVVSNMEHLHVSIINTWHILAKQFTQLGAQGFCTPSNDEAEKAKGSEGLEDGTGLGMGEGAEDISKDIESLEELGDEIKGQDQREEGEKEHVESEENAVDMNGEEMDGDMTDVSQADDESQQSDAGEDGGDGDDVDDEVASVDDLDPSAVDEKLWDEANANSSKEIEGDGKTGDEKEDGSTAQQNQATEEDDGSEADDGSTEDGNDFVEDLNKDLNQLDPHLQESEQMEVPDDINFDENAPSDDSMHEDDFEEEDDSNDTPPDLDQVASVSSESGGEQETGQGAEEADLEQSAKMDSAEEHKSPDKEEMNDIGEGNENFMRTDQGLSKAPSDEIGGDKQQRDHDHHSPVASEQQLPDDDHNEIGGENGGRKRTEAQENSDGNDANGQMSRNDPSTQSEDASKALEETPLRQFGDALQKWINTRESIRQSETQTEVSDQPREPNEINVKELEYAPEENGDTHAQAVDTVAADEAMDLNWEMEIDTIDSTSADGDNGEDEKQPLKEVESTVDAENRRRALDSAELPKAITADHASPDAMDIDRREDYEDTEEQVNKMGKSNQADLSTKLPLNEARTRWNGFESATRSLSLILTEKLRLVLAPTIATKMRGGFRSGKRLNIKAVIPYIASQYKRDKIWMRRSVPSKRSYQIMIAIDDSESMAGSHSANLAFETLALAAKSLSMLEAGELCIVGFGDDVNIIHPFSLPYSSDCGATILQGLTFAQKSTNVKGLVDKSIHTFKEARQRHAGGSSGNLWQLMLIVSDGLCEDHASIQRLVRRAQSERIMIVFIVIDSLSNTSGDQGAAQSIVDLQRAEFTQGPKGEVQVVRKKYMDTFPFRWYIVVRDINALPGVLAASLRQWFAEVAESSD